MVICDFYVIWCARAQWFQLLVRVWEYLWVYTTYNSINEFVILIILIGRMGSRIGRKLNCRIFPVSLDDISCMICNFLIIKDEMCSVMKKWVEWKINQVVSPPPNWHSFEFPGLCKSSEDVLQEHEKSPSMILVFWAPSYAQVWPWFMEQFIYNQNGNSWNILWI